MNFWFLVLLSALYLINNCSAGCKYTLNKHNNYFQLNFIENFFLQIKKNFNALKSEFLIWKVGYFIASYCGESQKNMNNIVFYDFDAKIAR